ncbi:MAG: trypsin-like peptidase domain-containing protein [Planctomycetes bacterium]|nr:trypsin-like peptidase domain-containing protein [Planctomycetota bacterium]
MSPRLLALVALVALVAGSASAQDKPLDPAALTKVKAASVYIQVKLQDGRIATGSGFLTDEPGLVVTNAHVLNMLDPDSRIPVMVDVTVNPGTPAS